MADEPETLSMRDFQAVKGVRLGIEHTISRECFECLLMDAKERGVDLVDIYTEIMGPALLDYLKRRVEERAKAARPGLKPAKAKRHYADDDMGSVDVLPAEGEGASAPVPSPQGSLKAKAHPAAPVAVVSGLPLDLEAALGAVPAGRRGKKKAPVKAPAAPPAPKKAPAKKLAAQKKVAAPKPKVAHDKKTKVRKTARKGFGRGTD